MTVAAATGGHFTIGEMVFSQTAIRLGIDNTPPAYAVANMHLLFATLEQVRALTGKPVSISSGYRCAALNAAIKGAGNSAHLTGQAADINCPGMTPKALAIAIRDSDIAFDQLIFEGSWVHIALAGGKSPREVLTAHFGGVNTTYTRGIA